MIEILISFNEYLLLVLTISSINSFIIRLIFVNIISMKILLRRVSVMTGESLMIRISIIR